MTLYRQLLATMLALFAVLFVSAYMVQFNSTRSYLTEQLSQDEPSTYIYLQKLGKPRLRY